MIATIATVATAANIVAKLRCRQQQLARPSSAVVAATAAVVIAGQRPQ